MCPLLTSIPLTHVRIQLTAFGIRLQVQVYVSLYMSLSLPTAVPVPDSTPLIIGLVVAAVIVILLLILAICIIVLVWKRCRDMSESLLTCIEWLGGTPAVMQH